jgi:hypothetical protein
MDVFFDILPVWPMPLIFAAAFTLAGLLVCRVLSERRDASIRRQWPALILRTIIILLLAVILINPVKIVPKKSGIKQKLTVLLDRSASMAVTDTGNRSRFDHAVSHLLDQKVMDRLGSRFDLDLRVFHRRVNQSALTGLGKIQPDGTGSDIGAALNRAISDLSKTEPNAGILLISDGRSTQGDPIEAARLAVADSVPLWTWCLGGTVTRQDVRMETAANEILAFAGANVDLKGRIRQYGYHRRSFQVSLLKDEAVLSQQEILPGKDGTAPVTFAIKAPERGEHRYVMRVAEQPGEANIVNNERPVFIRAVGEKVKILLAESEPHWDTKFLVHTLRRHDRVDLTAIYRLGEDRFSAIVASEGRFRRESTNLFPATRDTLFDYDICILGRGCETFFNRETESSLAEFVAERGGGLVFARGKPYNGRFASLAALEPIVWGKGKMAVGRVRITREGRRTPLFDFDVMAEDQHAIPGNLPLPGQASMTRGEKPMAVVLAVANGRPPDNADHILMAYQNYGLGRVVSLNAGGLWHWAFREKTDDQMEDAYQRFWLALIQWLLAHGEFLPGTDVALRTERRYYSDEDRIELMILTKGLSSETYRPKLVIRGKDVHQAIALGKDRGGQYRLSIGPFPAGIYDIVLANNVGRPAELTSRVEVVQSMAEFQDLSADPQLMHELATLSEGRTLKKEDISKLPEIVREWHQRRQLAYTHHILWDRWWILLPVITLLCLEWYLRRRTGLL